MVWNMACTAARRTLGMLLLLLPSAITEAGQAGPYDQVGVRRMAVLVPERGVELEATIWYPAAAGGIATKVGDNAVFQGAPARLDAPIADGSWPLILLSHGGLRSAPDSGAWIASRLAVAGFVVAASQPPRLEGERTRNAASEPWLRLADLSATLSALARDPALGTRLDIDAVGALGFQLGGTAALTLVGARLDQRAYAHLCDRDPAAVDCLWFAAQGIDPHAIDVAPAARSRPEPRVRAVVAVDPELAEGLEPVSLTTIAASVLIIDIGGVEARASEPDGSSLARAIPGADDALISDASPFSALNPCKPKGAAILREERDEAVCSDGRRPRVEVHAVLAEMTAAFFVAHLKNGR
jgi:predicted dienelactone hydrolase